MRHNGPMHVTIPRNVWSCCLPVGAESSSMPWIFLQSGCIPLQLLKTPNNDTFSQCNSNFLLFKTNPSFWQTLRKFVRFVSSSSWLTLNCHLSLMPMTLGHFAKIRSIQSWKTSWLIFPLNCILFYLKQPWSDGSVERLCGINLCKDHHSSQLLGNFPYSTGFVAFTDDGFV